MLSALLAGIAQAEPLRVGVLSVAPPFVMPQSSTDVLSDELSILYTGSAQPEVSRFTDAAQAREALENKSIDLLIASRPPADNLVASEPLLAFPLARLTLENGPKRTLCFPELPADFKEPCQATSSVSTDDTLLRMIRGEAGRFIAPEFILRNRLAHAPATTLKIEPLEQTPPLHFYGWALPGNTAPLAQLNAQIHALSQEDAQWLEQKWLLPEESVFSARNPPANEHASLMPLTVQLPFAMTPLVELTPEGQLYGVWHDLVRNLFPANRFALTFRLMTSSSSLPENNDRATLRIVAGVTPPSPQAIAFDSLNWALIGPPGQKLTGNLPQLQHRRIAVIRHSALAAVLRQVLAQENVVLVDDLSRGFELLKAGGADGLAGDAWVLNYALLQRNEKALGLTPLALAPMTLWFVPHIADPVEARRVEEILASITPADLSRERAQALNVLADRPPPQPPSLWIILLAVVTLGAALIALVAWNSAQRQRKLRERDTAALHNALSLWQTLMNNAPVPLFVSDASGRLNRFNDTFSHSPLLTGAAQKGLPLQGLLQGELAEQLALPHRLALLNSAEPLTGEATVNEGDTTLYWWLCRYTDNRGRPQGVVGGWVDISEKAALTLALNHALAQAERGSTEKSAFLARMSHDIRTPLNALLGLLELERHKSDSLQIAWQAAESLRDLIGDILDLSRIEAGELRLDLAPHPLWQVLNANVALFANSAKVKGLRWQSELAVPEDALYSFDKARLNQVVANLLGNAIKYTPEGEVTFHARLEENSLLLTISDTGVGIPADAMPSVGQPWFQTDSAVPESSGLGLAICYQLVGLMGGSLTLDSELNQGTKATVSLPLLPVAAGMVEVVVPSLSALPRQRILIVDDFPANLTVLTLQLEKLGQTVMACPNAAEAFAWLKNNTADIAITDCQMPQVNGYQFTATLRLMDLAGVISAPRVVLGSTASALQEEDERARHAGMDALLRKPLTADALAQALTRHQLREEKPDMAELQRLANGRAEVLVLMRQQMHETLCQDLEQLEGCEDSATELSRIAHRLKGTWGLFGMRSAVLQCQALENLSECLAAGTFDAAWLPELNARFRQATIEHQQELDNALRELSDQY
jgi:Signal transduction histidine kinase